MRPVLAIATHPFANQFEAVVLVIVIGVPEAVHVVAFLAHAIHVEAAFMIKQAHGACDRKADRFLHRYLP